MKKNDEEEVGPLCDDREHNPEGEKRKEKQENKVEPKEKGFEKSPGKHGSQQGVFMFLDYFLKRCFDV